MLLDDVHETQNVRCEYRPAVYSQDKKTLYVYWVQYCQNLTEKKVEIEKKKETRIVMMLFRFFFLLFE